MQRLWSWESRLRHVSRLLVVAALWGTICGVSEAHVAAAERPETVTRAARAAVPLAPGCVGDCNGDGAVTIDEVILGVSIALDEQALANCPAFDPNGSGVLTVDGLVMAVNNALDGCAMPDATASVLEHHHAGDRRGVYVMPALTRAAAATLVLDATFTPSVAGSVYAQPLYVADAGGGDRVFVATELNQVSAFAATDGSIAWQRTLAPPMDGSVLPCGNINPLGITGTPIIDLPSRTLFLDAMTDAGGNTAAHQIFALSIDDGSTRPGWPIDANTAIASAGTTFNSTVQNQRPALTILDGKLYVAYGGLAGDCGTYYGWLAGIDIGNPVAAIPTWRSPLIGTALWGMSGPSTDGQFLYMTTGNTTEPPSHTWQETESILRWNPGPTFSGNALDFFAPANFFDLDQRDVDLGGTAPILVDLKGPPPASLVIALGKDGNIYLVDRGNLDGVGGDLFHLQVANGAIINAAASYTTAQGTYVVFKAAGGIGCPGAVGDLIAVQLLPGTPPSAHVAWCASQHGGGSPMVTQTQADGGDTIVWGLGTEGTFEGPGDSRLHGFDGDTGAVVYDGGGPAEQMGPLHRFITPIAARGRIFVAGDNRGYAFRVP